jgi:hypothetical protein
MARLGIVTFMLMALSSASMILMLELLPASDNSDPDADLLTWNNKKDE